MTPMRARSPASPPPDVPRAREITEGMRGDDVIAVKHGLSRAGYLRWGAFTPLWGPSVIAAAQHFRERPRRTARAWLLRAAHACRAGRHASQGPRRGVGLRCPLDRIDAALLRSRCGRAGDCHSWRNRRRGRPPVRAPGPDRLHPGPSVPARRAAVPAGAARLLGLRHGLPLRRQGDDRRARLQRPGGIPALS